MKFLLVVLCSAAICISQAFGQTNDPNDPDATLSTIGTTDVTDVSPKPAQQNQCEIGECVAYYLCANGSVITSGEGILDVRLGAEDDPEPEKHPCPDFFETCCLIKGKELITEVKSQITKTDKCGIRNKKGNGFTVLPRDNEAQFAEFPWVVAVIYRVHEQDSVVNVYKCAGSLIHPSVVMTVAHCVIDLKDITDVKIRAGEWDTQTSNEPFPHQDREIVEVIIHEHYRRGSHFNDIALLFLNKPVDLAENVNTVCLPPPNHVFDHKRCAATGWGKDKFGSNGLYQVIMKKVELPIVPSAECQIKLRETRLGRHFILDPSFICAGGESGKDTCQGDGGAPLVCDTEGDISDQVYQAGMVAWGIGCNDPIPGVYVNVAKFREWIDNVFDKHTLEQKYYTA